MEYKENHRAHTLHLRRLFIEDHLTMMRYQDVLYQKRHESTRYQELSEFAFDGLDADGREFVRGAKAGC